MPAPAVRMLESAALRAALTLIAATLSTLLAAVLLLVSVSLAITYTDMGGNPAASPADLQQTKLAADITWWASLPVILLSAHLLARSFSFRGRGTQILGWIASLVAVTAVSWVLAVIWLPGLAPDFIWEAREAMERIVLQSVTPLVHPSA